MLPGVPGGFSANYNAGLEGEPWAEQEVGTSGSPKAAPLPRPHLLLPDWCALWLQCPKRLVPPGCGTRWCVGPANPPGAPIWVGCSVLSASCPRNPKAVFCSFLREKESRDREGRRERKNHKQTLPLVRARCEGQSHHSGTLT